MDIRDSSSSLPQPALDGDEPAAKRRKANRKRRDASASNVARPTRSSLQRALGGKEYDEDDDESIVIRTQYRKKSAKKKSIRKKSAAQLQEEALDASALSVLDATHYNGGAVNPKKVRGVLSQDGFDDDKSGDLSEADLKVPAYLRKKGRKSLHDEVLEERPIKPRSRAKAKANLEDSDAEQVREEEAKTKAPKRRRKKASVDDNSFDNDSLNDDSFNKREIPKKQRRQKDEPAKNKKRTRQKQKENESSTSDRLSSEKFAHHLRNPAKHVRFSALPIEILGLCAIAAGVLLSLSLVSFSAMDLAALANGESVVANWIGPFGAWSAGLLVTVLGMGAFASPLVLFSVGVWCFRRRVMRPRWHQALGLALAAIGFATLLDVVFAANKDIPFAAGGLMGAALASVLIGALAPLGTGILATLATGAGLLLAIDRSLSKVVQDSVAFMQEILSVLRELVGVQLEKARILDEERDELEEEAHQERIRRKKERALSEQDRNERVRARAKKSAKNLVMDDLDEASRVLRLPTPGVLDVDLSHANVPRRKSLKMTRGKRDPQWSADDVNVAHLDASMPRILRPQTLVAGVEEGETEILIPENTQGKIVKKDQNSSRSIAMLSSSVLDDDQKITPPTSSVSKEVPRVEKGELKEIRVVKTLAKAAEEPFLPPNNLLNDVDKCDEAPVAKRVPPVLPDDASGDDILIKSRVGANLAAGDEVKAPEKRTAPAESNLDDTLVSPVPAFLDEVKEGRPVEKSPTLTNDSCPKEVKNGVDVVDTPRNVQEKVNEVAKAKASQCGDDVANVEPSEEGEQLLIKERQAPQDLADNVDDEEPYTRYEMPPLSLLNYDAPERAPIDAERMRRQADKLVQTFGNFGIEGKVREIRPGPIVTTYEFVPAPGIKVSKIASLSDDIAMAMAAVHVRIVAPIPGKGAIGIEIPNDERETVYLKEIIGDKEFIKEGDSKLKMAMGKDIEGKTYFADLGGMPHVLISGTTGSGKSVAVNGMIASLLYRATPDEVKFLMIDPKMLELSIYDGIPHLLLPPIIDTSKAANALRWTVEEMDRRYHAMSSLGVRDIKGYNEVIEKIRNKEHPTHHKMPVDDRGKAYQKSPYIVVIIDEYADLLSTAGKDVEVYVMRLAQKARAAGIHVMLATQRPSVDVITGVIKANFPVRMGFRLASTHDSKTIINRPGAEKLLGRGDMLMMPAGTSDVTRVHGAFVSEVELHRVVEHWKGQGKPKYDMSIIAPPADEAGPSDEGGDAPLDARWDDAIAIVARSRRCSTSWLQRQMGVGYNRAARIVERLEKEGLVGPQLNSKGDRDINIPPQD